MDFFRDPIFDMVYGIRKQKLGWSNDIKTTIEQCSKIDGRQIATTWEKN